VYKRHVYNNGWSSSAFSSQNFYYLDLKGRVHLDLLIYVKREYKLASYKLGIVASHFLSTTKDPFKIRHIRESYISGKKNHPRPSAAIGLIGSYCVKDSLLVIQLLKHLKLWESSASMASICQTSLIDLFTHGQTFKVFSQVYKFCLSNRIVVENNSYYTDPDAIVEGAFVLQPLAGLYENVVSFDFASLYPSIIISHNIDFGTLVADDNKDITDEQCNIIEWEEHYGCICEGAKPSKKMGTGKKIIVCKKHRYRWLKEPKGVLPTIIENLIKARKDVRARMKTLDAESSQYLLLNQLQLAFKVSANSIYGSLASRFGLLQFLVGGMCVTAIGRRSVKRVVHLMETEHRAKVIYGDTDSAYVKFRDMPRDKLYTYCNEVSKKISEHFPRPMNLEFEGKIYQFYFIFSKKRYIYKLYDKESLTVSGVLLKRRDSSLIVKEIYQQLVDSCLKRVSADELWARFFQSISILLCGCRGAEEYAIGKSVKTIESFPIRDRSEKKMYFGDYIVPRLPEDPVAREKILKKKGAVDDIDFYKKSLNSHVQLALKMRDRGQTIQNGSRLDFLYIKGHDKAPTVDKMEELEYFQQVYPNSTINTSEYLRLLCEKPLTELFRVYLDEDYSVFFKAISIVARRKNDLIAQLKEFLQPKIVFADL
jgi:DNA polymerase elongation subunit (family B)